MIQIYEYINDALILGDNLSPNKFIAPQWAIFLMILFKKSKKNLFFFA